MSIGALEREFTWATPDVAAIITIASAGASRSGGVPRAAFAKAAFQCVMRSTFGPAPRGTVLPLMLIEPRVNAAFENHALALVENVEAAGLHVADRGLAGQGARTGDRARPGVDDRFVGGEARGLGVVRANVPLEVQHAGVLVVDAVVGREGGGVGSLRIQGHRRIAQQHPLERLLVTRGLSRAEGVGAPLAVAPEEMGIDHFDRRGGV